MVLNVSILALNIVCNLLYSVFKIKNKMSSALFCVVEQHFQCGLCTQVGWNTARDYYTFLWSPMPENYEPGSTVHRTVVFQGTHAHAHAHYVNHCTDPGYSKVTPPFYGKYKNQHFYLIREHNRKWRPGT